MYGIALLALTLLGAFCRSHHEEKNTSPITANALPWNEAKVQAHLQFITTVEHPMGSARQQDIVAYMKRQAEALGLEVTIDDFNVEVPDPSIGPTTSPMQKLTLSIPLSNVYVRLPSPNRKCTILLGSHYDSKRLEGKVSLGANDSGSSSAALLEIMNILSQMKDNLPCNILAVWFDGEEAYLPEWNDGQTRHPAAQIDHLYGSRHLAQQLKGCEGKICLPQKLGGDPIRAMILLDMIGMPSATLSRDTNSDPSLLATAITLDKAWFSARYFQASRSHPVEDDHIPFVEKGIPALNLINFEDISTWHSEHDTLSTLSMSSIQEVSKLAMGVILALPDSAVK